MTAGAAGRPRLVATAAIMALIVVLLAVPSLGCGSSTTTGGSARAAADFSGVTLDGANVSLSEYRGKPLVLAFMASW
ncbi:MAG: hypothetical protein V1912_05695 [bacterium]